MKKSVEWMLGYVESALDAGAAIDVLFNGERFRVHSISNEVAEGLITVTLHDGGGVLAFDAASNWGVFRAD